MDEAMPFGLPPLAAKQCNFDLSGKSTEPMCSPTPPAVKPTLDPLPGCGPQLHEPAATATLANMFTSGESAYSFEPKELANDDVTGHVRRPKYTLNAIQKRAEQDQGSIEVPMLPAPPSRLSIESSCRCREGMKEHLSTIDAKDVALQGSQEFRFQAKSTSTTSKSPSSIGDASCQIPFIPTIFLAQSIEDTFALSNSQSSNSLSATSNSTLPSSASDDKLSHKPWSLSFPSDNPISPGRGTSGSAPKDAQMITTPLINGNDDDWKAAVNPFPVDHRPSTETPQRANDYPNLGLLSPTPNETPKRTTETSTLSIRSSARTRASLSPQPSCCNNSSKDSSIRGEENAFDSSPSKQPKRKAKERFTQQNGDVEIVGRPSDVHRGLSEEHIEDVSRSASRAETEGMNCLELDDQLRFMIKRSLTPRQVEALANNTLGYVYILENRIDLKDGFWKIGMTNGLPTDRAATWSKTCKVPIKHHYHGPAIAVARRAEELCQTHLQNFNVPYSCPSCRTSVRKKQKQHGEFFKVDYDRARSYVNLWSEFLHHRPYDESGRLHQFWLEELKKVPRPEKNLHGDHEEQLERWGKFLQFGKKPKWLCEKSRAEAARVEKIIDEAVAKRIFQPVSWRPLHA